MLRVADSSAAITLAGLIAGAAATLAQLLLWWVFTNGLPGLLFRDARLTAALLLGRSVLPPPATFDFGVMLTASLIHFALSVAYTALLVSLTGRLNRASALLAGAAFGIALYAVNLHGFTLAFPWFAPARGWIALAAHATFGSSAVLAFRSLHAGNPDD